MCTILVSTPSRGCTSGKLPNPPSCVTYPEAQGSSGRESRCLPQTRPHQHSACKRAAARAAHLLQQSDEPPQGVGGGGPKHQATQQVLAGKQAMAPQQLAAC